METERVLVEQVHVMQNKYTGYFVGGNFVQQCNDYLMNLQMQDDYYGHKILTFTKHEMIVVYTISVEKEKHAVVSRTSRSVEL